MCGRGCWGQGLLGRVHSFVYSPISLPWGEGLAFSPGKGGGEGKKEKDKSAGQVLVEEGVKLALKCYRLSS